MGRKKKEKPKVKGQLPSGSIRRLIYIGKDDSGKKKYKSFTAATENDLDLMIAAWKVARAAGQADSEEHPHLTVSAAVERYTELKRAVLSPATVKAYSSVRKTYIEADSIGGRDVNRLTQQDVQLWVSTIARKVQPKTVRNAYALLASSVRMFRPEWTVRITLPQKKPKELYCPSDNDVKALLTAVDDRELEIAILLAAFGPMRRSEICALESSDIHGDRVTISKALVQDEIGAWILKEPKTVSSRRTIRLPDFVIAKLAGIDGRIIKCTPSALSDRFNRVMAEADCPRFRFHDLRHYGASIMHAIGVPDKYVMARGGWASDNVMKRIYQNIIEDEEIRQTEKINGHFSALLSG